MQGDRGQRSLAAASAAFLGGESAGFTDVVLQCLRDARALDLKDAWRVIGTCTAFRAARDHLLAQYDQYVDDLRACARRKLTWAPTANANLSSMSQSPKFYYADTLVRSFLQYVLHGQRRVVLAGSAGAELGVSRSWSPTYLAFFVEEEKCVDQIRSAYVAGVLTPLGFRWSSYAASISDESSDIDELEQLDERDWFDDMMFNNVGADVHDDLRTMVNRRSADRSALSYDVLQKAIIRPVSQSSRRPEYPRDLRDLVRPIKIVLVRVPERPEMTMDLAACVRTGFDVVPSAVTVSMGDDFTFRCACDFRTFAAVRNSLVFFNPDTVSCRKFKDVPRMIQEARMYVSRGFTFRPPATARLGSISSYQRDVGDTVVEL